MKLLDVMVPFWIVTKDDTLVGDFLEHVESDEITISLLDVTVDDEDLFGIDLDIVFL